MNHDLQQRISALRSIERRVKPDVAWVKNTREILLMQVKNSLPTEQLGFARRIKQLIKHFVPTQLIQLVRGPVMAGISVLLIVLGSSVASVSAAEYSLPGDFLYSLKLATEQARLVLTPKKEEKLKLKIEFTKRRVDELKEVAKQDSPKKPERVVQAAEILKRDLKTVKDQLEEVKTEVSAQTAVEVAKLVDQKSNEVVQTLQETKSDLPDETKEKVIEAQAAAADTGVKALEVLVEKHDEAEENIGKEEVVSVIEGHSKTVADVTGISGLSAATSSLLTATSTAEAPLKEVVQQIKEATQQAFAAQKQIASESQAGSATSSVSGEVSSSTAPISPEVTPEAETTNVPAQTNSTNTSTSTQ